jgi:hypothetical protein
MANKTYKAQGSEDPNNPESRSPYADPHTIGRKNPNVHDVGFFNTSGPRRQLSIGGGIAIGAVTALFGAPILAATAVGVGSVAAIWYGFQKLGK